MARVLTSAAAIATALCVVPPWNPKPPCITTVPNTPVNESMCSNVIASNGNVFVKQYGLPVNETLVVVQVAGGNLYVDAVVAAAQYIIDFFIGSNDERLNILSSRTVPLTIRPPSPATNNQWLGTMMVSTANYPDSFKIPSPYPPSAGTTLQKVGYRLFATIQFTTTTTPEQPDFEEACGAVSANLPAGYAVNTTSPWTPTWVLYNGEYEQTLWTNECWLEVTAA